MTSPSGPAVIGGEAGKGSPAAVTAQPAEQAYDRGPLWMRLLPPLVTLGFVLYSITAPSFWRDEAATLAAVKRPFGDLIRMLGNVDAVHGLYYLFAWVIARAFGTGELALRLPSALAMAVAAGFVAAIGRRLVSPLAGLAAGLVFAIIPMVTVYGQTARSYAMVTAMAAVASYLLIRVLHAAPGTRRRWWLGYDAALIVLGYLNIFALLLIPAHGVTIALRCWRPPAGEARRRLALSWLAAAAAAAALTSPVLYLAWRQRGQVSWLKVPDWADGVNQLVGPIKMTIALAVVVAAGLGVSAYAGSAWLRAKWPIGRDDGGHAGRAGLPQRWPAGLIQLSVPWLVLPPALLLTGSLLTPLYTFRYILFCIPAVALLGGIALAALGRIAGALGLVVVLVLGLHAQGHARSPHGHKDNIRLADEIIARNARRGTAVLYTNANAQTFPAAYPYGFNKLRDIALARQPIPSATLGGVNAPPQVIDNRIAQVRWIWVVNINHDVSPDPSLYGASFHPLKTLYANHFHLVREWQVSDIWLRLYQRRA
jgi:mannosyltransferase